MSLTLILTLAAIAVLAVTLVAVGLPLIQRLRAHEEGGSSLPPPSDAGVAEMRDLGERIAALVVQQQEHGETQQQRVAQQIDSVQRSVGEQRVLVDGLRSEVRHEVQRRDHELEEIRNQIASIKQAVPALAGRPQLALPEAQLIAPGPLGDAPETSARTDDWTDAEWTDVAPEADAAPAADPRTAPARFLAPAETPIAFVDVEAAPDAGHPVGEGQRDEAPAGALATSLVFADDAPEAPVTEATAPDAPVTDDPATTADPYEAPFKQLSLAEMNFDAPSDDDDFDPESAFPDLTLDETGSHQDDVGVFADAFVPAAFDAPPFADSAEAAPVNGADGFAPAPFLDEAPDSESDPLAAAATFVPPPIAPDVTPTDVEPLFESSGDAVPAEDVFAGWTPPAFDAPPSTPAAEALDIADLDAEADLSTFEDWGLDPVSPTADDAPAWAPNAPADATFATWTDAAEPAEGSPLPEFVVAQDLDAPGADGDPSPSTAWVARNERVEPTGPPQTVTPPETDYAEAGHAAGGSGFEVVPISGVASAPATPAAPAAPSAHQAPSAHGPTVEEEPAERLTSLPSIDEDIERALRSAGVTSLDEIARWNRTDARRIAGQVGVSENTVLNHWVFEAQTALFERFTQQVGG